MYTTRLMSNPFNPFAIIADVFSSPSPEKVGELHLSRVAEQVIFDRDAVIEQVRQNAQNSARVSNPGIFELAVQKVVELNGRSVVGQEYATAQNLTEVAGKSATATATADVVDLDRYRAAKAYELTDSVAIARAEVEAAFRQAS